MNDVAISNQKYFDLIADMYGLDEPHFKRENRERVQRKLGELRSNFTSGFVELLDIGCGTGFILGLAERLFDRLYGCDISAGMLGKAVFPPNVVLRQTTADDLFFLSDGSINVVTAYAVLHHLDELEPTLRECYRVLDHDGVFWSGLDPHRGFRQWIRSLEQGKQSGIIESEIIKLDLRNPAQDKVEPIVANNDGFKADALLYTFENVGFVDVKIDYHWYIGQKQYPEAESYLRSLLPATANMFKYIEVTARKP
jgi:SAM-dependent methyltransferase